MLHRDIRDRMYGVPGQGFRVKRLRRQFAKSGARHVGRRSVWASLITEPKLLVFGREWRNGLLD